ncbi:MAG TPA: TolC family protein [Bryobacteraceae bacterium]|nr:TolC family protein [Bryobacteraceae bacterium]
MMHRFLFIVALVPALGAQQGPLKLSLRRAVEMALAPEGNARLELAGEAVRQAEARSVQARGALLPNLDATVGYQNLTRNLAAMGIRVDLPIPGFQFPNKVGPFNVFDARASGSQSIFDFSAIRRYQASRAGIGAARAETENAAEQVAAQVAQTYLAALKTEADLEAVRANIALDEAIVRQAESLKSAGTGTGIEITRARVQLANQQQRLLVVENERRRARLQLLRAMGMRLDTAVELTDRLEYVPVDATTLDDARKAALKARPDLRSQQERESNARLAASATTLERLPSLAAFADYGSIGTGISSALPTRTYGLSLRVPVFDGGRRDARRAESASLYRQERIRTTDLQDQIELEIRVALDALASADQQVKVATEGLELAENELAQARRRYDAGVAAGIEVTDAQTRLERARDNRTAALYNHNLARIELAQSTGGVRRMIP